MYEAAAAAASRPLNDDAGSGGVSSFAEAAKSLLTCVSLATMKSFPLTSQILFQRLPGVQMAMFGRKQRYISLDRE